MDETLTYRRIVHSIVYEAYFGLNKLYGRGVLVVAYNLGKSCMELENRLLMAKKNNAPSNIQKPDYTSVKWVNRQLTSEEKEQHDSGNVRPEKIFKDLLALALSGYNIGIKWDGYSSCFQTTLIPFNTASPNYGFGLSARAADPFRAISLLLFKHYEVLQEDWQKAYKPSGNSLEG